VVNGTGHSVSTEVRQRHAKDARHKSLTGAVRENRRDLITAMAAEVVRTSTHRPPKVAVDDPKGRRVTLARESEPPRIFWANDARCDRVTFGRLENRHPRTWNGQRNLLVGRKTKQPALANAGDKSGIFHRSAHNSFRKFTGNWNYMPLVL